MRPEKTTILRILEQLDWTTHIEISYNDMVWLSEQISTRLTNPDMQICDNCDMPRDIVVNTAIGSICESCLDTLSESAEDMREALED